jgi:hypothetical protein
MSHKFWNQETAALAILLLGAISGRTQTAASAGVGKTFSSPEEAGAAVHSAARSGDQKAMIAIFGPGSRAVLFTGDAKTDKARLNNFVTAYNQMHRWGKVKAGGQVLLVGYENSPFPIPLGQNSAGRWYFDTAAGKDEILARRIGKNELTAIDGVQALADAERQYFDETRDGSTVKQYAQKFVSDPGQQNGLYWPPANGRTPSPLDRFADFANAQHTAGMPEFNGYYYRILSKAETPEGAKDFIVDGKMTGGFAILAFPAEYRNSGLMSFLIGPDGTIYQKDLGERSVNVGANITAYNPADGWTPVNAPVASASAKLP